MKTVHLFSLEERAELLKEFCKVNHLSYYMVCEIMFNDLLGEKSAKDSMKSFQYYLSGKLGISVDSIKFEE